VSASRKGILAAFAIAIALAAAPSAAGATTRYASPGGVTSGNCTSPSPSDPTNPPCDLTHVVTFVAVGGDEVIVTPGTYDLGSGELIINKAINVHGQDGAPRPLILSSSGSFGATVNVPGAALRRMEIDYTGPFEGLDVSDGSTEQLVVHSTGAYSCLVESNATLRDSVCLNTASGGIGVELQTPFATVSAANLRNVTAVGTAPTSYGIQVETFNSGDEQDAVAKNVIANGVAADVHASENTAGAVSTITLSNSNYDSQLETGSTAAVTDPGTGTGNQTAAPLFTDAGAGLFHEAAGSPTIDAGAVTDLLGTLDIDGEARTLGTVPDIGADEFVPPASPAPPTSTPTTTATFNLVAAIRRCKKKFRKGTKVRKRCIKKARARALAIAGA
jgi:hypothetical protein